MRDLTKDSTHLIVHDVTQTFLDNVLIESVHNVTRRWHQPERRSDKPLITKDRPWEHSIYLNYTNYFVLRDPADGLFKCWYDDMDGPRDDVKTNFGRYSRRLYAESSDGLEWRKPELDLYLVDGRKTNIVLGGPEFGQVSGGSVVIDPNPPSPQERLRTMYNRFIPGKTGPSAMPTATWTVEAAHSPDGIHWTAYDELPMFGTSGANLGDSSLLYYDHFALDFVQTTRHAFIEAGYGNPHVPRPPTHFFQPHEPHDLTANSQRRMWLSRSHDFLHWSEPILIAAVDDDEDNLDESYYSMPMFRVGTSYLGTAGLLHAVDNETEVQLLTSRDGVRWRTTNKRQPFFAPRGDGYWDAHMTLMSCPPIEVDDELWFFYGASNFRHDWWLMGAFGEPIDHDEARNPEGVSFGLGLATLRKEGFAGLFANQVREGLVVTNPLRSMGSELVINGKCAPGGTIRVEVTDGRDQVLAACSKENNDVFKGDDVAHTVTWQGDARIPTTTTDRGWPEVRKIRFYLRNAEIFSFRFADSRQK